ncbi:MAG: penicillin-binding protein 2 [Thermoanaerobacterales bacterium]|nr:penicillin-binding protein 2 [Bacillota bacterium]MDI6906466.1 penicillin-binding protein 2 [Thermoanaerobacterales bacterium]
MDKRKHLQRKSNVLIAFIAVLFLVLLGRLAYLQIYETEHYRTLARENSMRLITIPAPRGEIFDRNGKKLVGNRPLYSVSLINVGLSDEELNRVIDRLSVILGKDRVEITRLVDEGALRRFEPVRVAKDVPLDVVTRIEEERMELKGVVIDTTPMRDYPYGNLLAHVLGYIREISSEQLAKYRDRGYRLGDMFGQAGLENAFESELRGEPGAYQLEVDAYANPVRSLGIKNPVPGDNLVLTIDFETQKAAEEALARVIAQEQKMGNKECRAGAAVAINVRTGDILAMASYPAFNPGMFAGELSPQVAEQIINSPDRLFLNRAIQSAYPPGSTFKMVVAAAALESGKVHPDYTIYDPGYFVLGRRYTDWVSTGHGRVNLARAIQVSCDTYFWTVGRMVGNEAISDWAKRFGLGERTGLGLPGEAKGVVPTPAYKKELYQALLDRKYKPQFAALDEKYEALTAMAPDDKTKRELARQKERERARIQADYDRDAWELEWRPYDTLNMSIGQGYNLYTPLQLANYIATLANGGTRYKPYLVKQVVSPDGRVVREFKPEAVGRDGLSPGARQAILKGMRMVTQPGGTGYGLFRDFPVATAGKTGTAEVFGHQAHGLYVAFAPFEKPDIAVAVIVEHGRHGSSTAGLVARDMIAAYLRLPVKTETVVPVTE